MKALLYALVLLGMLACTKSIFSVSTTNDESKNLTGYDVFSQYSLPKTELKLRIPVVVNTLETGLVEGEAKDDPCLKSFLKINFGWVPESAPKEKFTIDQKIILTPITLPDPDKRYALIYKYSKAISQNLNFSISKDGLIQSGEFAQESRTFEIVTKTTQVIGTLVGAVAGLGSEKIKNPKCSFDNIKNERAAKLISDLNTLLNARSTLISTPAVSLNNTEVPKMQLAEIDEQLKLIKAELLGKIKKEVHYVTIYIDPKIEKPTIDLFTLSPTLGIVSDGKDDWKNLKKILAPDPTKVTDGKKLHIQLRKLMNSEVFEFDKTVQKSENQVSQSKSTGKDAAQKDQTTPDAFLYYNLPTKYELTLVYGDSPIPTFSNKEQKEGNDDYQIYFPQLGKVAKLPVDFKDASIVYYEDIGSLKSAKFTRAAELDAARIQASFDVIDSLRKVAKAIREKNTTVEEPEVEEKTEEQVIRLIIQNIP